MSQLGLLTTAKDMCLQDWEGRSGRVEVGNNLFSFKLRIKYYYWQYFFKFIIQN